MAFGSPEVIKNPVFNNRKNYTYQKVNTYVLKHFQQI